MRGHFFRDPAILVAVLVEQFELETRACVATGLLGGVRVGHVIDHATQRPVRSMFVRVRLGRKDEHHVVGICHHRNEDPCVLACRLR